MTAVTQTELAGEGRLLRAFPAKAFTAVRAANAQMWDAEGRRILDFGGASHGVAVTGHNHPRVVAAIQAQAARLTHVAQGIPNPERATFLDRLHTHLPRELTRTFLANSGAEANECALKLAALGGRSRFVAATNAFHGRTTGSLAVTHRGTFRTPFASILPAADFVPFNDCEALKAATTTQTAAIVLEPVQGEGGIQSATPEFLRCARDVATDQGALLVFDEVQSGLGRTGSFLASTAAGVVPDVVTLAKGLAGGLPAGSCSVTDAVAARLPPGGHGSTYGGAPLACAAGSAVLDVLDDERLPERAVEVGGNVLRTVTGWSHPLVRAVHGRGLMVGIELRIRPQGVLDALQANGVLALGGGTTGIRLLPPLTTPQEQVDEALAALRSSLDAIGGA